MEEDKELRKSKEEVKKEYEELKISQKLDKESLTNLMSHCNVVPKITEYYLNIIEKEDKDLFLDELLYYYPILSVEVCKKFGVNKLKSEKDRFFELIQNLLGIERPNLETKLITFLKEEIQCLDEIKHLIPKNVIEEEKKEPEKDKELNKGKESKEEEKVVSDPFKYSRWLNTYNTEIDYKTEENEEFLFYHLSNLLISEFLRDKYCFRYRIKLIGNIIDSLEVAYSKRNKGDIFRKYFEFLCIALTNCENNKNFHNLKPILWSIGNEIKINDKFMNINEIKEYLTNNNYEYEHKDKMLKINKKGITYIIDDYTKYNINDKILDILLSRGSFEYKDYLEDNTKFSSYFDKIKSSTDLLQKIIKNYVKSNLAISSIEKLFNIKKNEYKTLFNELSENIEKYIYIIPYDCFYDTERTFKNPIKIIIDPFKEKYKLNVKHINNDLDLDIVLKEFCEIVFRKFSFEHEIHHLVTALLFFLYINEDSSLNSITKELMHNGEIKFHPEITFVKSFKNKNIQKEAGNMFELLCYGSIQKEFTLKQLLFIANEQNDNLNYETFKSKYKNDCDKDLNVLLDLFPENQLLSEHVKKIRDYLKNNPERLSIKKILSNDYVVSKDDVETQENIYSLLNDNNFALVETERYDNHLICEKRPKYKSTKKNNKK